MLIRRTRAYVALITVMIVCFSTIRV